MFIIIIIHYYWIHNTLIKKSLYACTSLNDTCSRVELSSRVQCCYLLCLWMLAEFVIVKIHPNMDSLGPISSLYNFAVDNFVSPSIIILKMSWFMILGSIRSFYGFVFVISICIITSSHTWNMIELVMSLINMCDSCWAMNREEMCNSLIDILNYEPQSTFNGDHVLW